MRDENGKICTVCRGREPQVVFGKNRAMPDGLQVTCKVCMRAKARVLRNTPEGRAKSSAYHIKWCRTPKGRAHLRAVHFRKKYLLTIEERDAMAAAQHGLCAICNTPPAKLVVDHCHSTGTIRKLLCSACNTAIGLFQEDCGRMLAAIQYLEEHNAATAVA